MENSAKASLTGITSEHSQSTARDEIVAALVASGLPSGQHHTGSGWSDEGGLEYMPPQHGWITVGVHDVELFDGERRHASFYESYYWAIDHAGKGRNEALLRYAVILQAAGWPVAFGKRRHQKKVLVIVDRSVSRRGGRWMDTL